MLFKRGDVDAFADNWKTKGKRPCVKEDGTTPLNVATNVVFIQSNPTTNYQSLFPLYPKNWLNKVLT